MIDYPALAALQAVIETQSFEAAAAQLFITQSAVSQRIKGLENHLGEPLLVRTLPFHPTPLGAQLLGHFQRVRLLEDSLQSHIEKRNEQPKITIALSRDSLETWFQVILRYLNQARLEIIADDQEVTLNYLKQGLVAACASTKPTPMTGCKVVFLGFFDYVLVASPEFKKRYFSREKNIKNNLLTAPTLLFDRKDDLPHRYLSHFFHIEAPITEYHIIPSVAGFRQLALDSYAYALIPKLDILDALKQKRLVELFPDKPWEMPVYWHTWNIETKTYKLFNQQVITHAKKILRQK